MSDDENGKTYFVVGSEAKQRCHSPLLWIDVPPLEDIPVAPAKTAPVATPVVKYVQAPSEPNGSFFRGENKEKGSNGV